MQRIQKQLNFQNRKISQFENDKKQMEIDHLKALLAVKQGSDVGSMKSLNRVPDRTREVGHFLNFFFFNASVFFITTNYRSEIVCLVIF